jgi:hypothetical protein
MAVPGRWEFKILAGQRPSPEEVFFFVWLCVCFLVCLTRYVTSYRLMNVVSAMVVVGAVRIWDWRIPPWFRRSEWSVASGIAIGSDARGLLGER